jgi:hypothetical protein
MSKNLKKQKSMLYSLHTEKKKVVVDYKIYLTCPLGLASQLSSWDNDGLPSSIYYRQIQSYKIDICIYVIKKNGKAINKTCNQKNTSHVSQWKLCKPCLYMTLWQHIQHMFELRISWRKVQMEMTYEYPVISSMFLD